MKTKLLVVLWVVFISTANVLGGLNVLVIGSTHSFSEGEKRGDADQRAFNASAVTDRLRAILARDTKYRKTANVVFEDIFRKKTLPTAIGGGGKLMTMEYRCYSLAQYYFWPDGRAERLRNLSGKGKTKWDYVVIVGDPYILANMPGVYAEGAGLIADMVKKGAAKPVLLMTWPEAGSSSTVANFGEIVYRVGKGAGIPVAPAGHAWSSLSKKDKSTEHPTAGGAYLAAACVYSEIVGRIAASSKYNDRAIAAHAFRTVKANKTKTQYTGRFDSKNPFAMKYVTKTSITYNHTGSSSERGIQGALEAAIKRCKVSCKKVAPGKNAKIDFNYGRANTIFEAHKKYKVAPRQFDRAYGFPMQDHGKTAAETMLYGIDKRYVGSRRYDDGTDLGIAYDMIRQGEVASDIRAVPIRLMWAKLHDANAKLKPLRDRWHMSRYLDEATGAFMYTLLSGRRPVVAEPSTKGSDAWNRWLGQKIGYETAWRMSHLTSPPSRP
ncbi:MAG: hypothetical protein QGH60_10085 [Phycisphaerae bacterium]|jgi:hypothetical protein|nr:hypothetical protein [Phycisphaerae bacterium]